MTDWYVFPNPVQVPSARGPETTLTIPKGTWLVIWEDMASRPGNPAECTVRQPGVADFRILRSELKKLCEEEKARPRGK